MGRYMQVHKLRQAVSNSKYCTHPTPYPLNPLNTPHTSTLHTHAKHTP